MLDGARCGVDRAHATPSSQQLEVEGDVLPRTCAIGDRSAPECSRRHPPTAVARSESYEVPTPWAGDAGKTPERPASGRGQGPSARDHGDALAPHGGSSAADTPSTNRRAIASMLKRERSARHASAKRRLRGWSRNNVTTAEA